MVAFLFKAVDDVAGIEGPEGLLSAGEELRRRGTGSRDIVVRVRAKLGQPTRRVRHVMARLQKKIIDNAFKFDTNKNSCIGII